MNIIWKGAAALGLTVAGLSMAVPAQAQYHGGYRDGWRGDRGHHWNNSRWDNRRHWRGHRRDWRDNRRYYRGYRQRCWTEWRYDYYRRRDVRVRICR